MDWTTLQEVLRVRLRAQHGSRAEVARRLSISPTAVSRYVSGGEAIPASHLDTILGVLGVTLELVPRQAS